MTNRQFGYYLDAVRFDAYTQRRFEWVLAGGEPDEFPNYESSVEGRAPTPEEVEARLSASPFVRRAPEPQPES